jgi:hypothetical protein
VSVGDVIVEVDGLTRVLLLKALVYERSVLWGDEEAWPADPREVKRLLEGRKGRDETARGHFEVILAIGVLADCNRETICDDDEVTALSYVHIWVI